MQLQECRRHLGGAWGGGCLSRLGERALAAGAIRGVAGC